jgi:hypothetical protein
MGPTGRLAKAIATISHPGDPTVKDRELIVLLARDFMKARKRGVKDGVKQAVDFLDKVEEELAESKRGKKRSGKPGPDPGPKSHWVM